MKKRLLLLPFLSLSALTVASQGDMDPELERITNEAKVVVYTITIYRDPKKCISPEWGNIIQTTVNSIKKSSADDSRKKESSDDSWILDLCRSLLEANKDKNSIHGEIKISVGNGECPEGSCPTPCECKARYRGVCPCSAGQSCCGS